MALAKCPKNKDHIICSNHGVCSGEECDCWIGYEGHACEIKQCMKNCNAHGDCFDGKCFCHPRWQGDYCDIPAAEECPNDCNNHGKCNEKEWVCECEDGYEGDDCSITNWYGLVFI